MNPEVIEILANESVASRRRVYFYVPDNIPGIGGPVLGLGGEQPQISSNGGSYTNTGIGVLVEVGNGDYYAELTQAAVLTGGTTIRSRFKTDDTLEVRGSMVRVVRFDPNSAQPFTVRKGVGFKWPMKFVSSTDHLTPVAGQTPTVTLSLDLPNSFSAAANSPSATSAFGWSSIQIADLDVAGDHYMILRATIAGGIADPYEQVFKIQAP